MKKENHLDFLTNRKNKYSIRKFSVGAASILVGSMIFISPQVDADETTDDGVTEEAVPVDEEPESTEEDTAQSEETADSEGDTSDSQVEEDTAEEENEGQVEETETEEQAEEEAAEEDVTEDTTGPEILGVNVYEGVSNEGTEDEVPFIAMDVTASDESEVTAVEGEFREVGNPENSQLTSLSTTEQDGDGNYIVTAAILPEPGVTYELVNVRVTDGHGNVTESADYNQQITAGDDVPEEEEEAEDYQSIEEAYLSFRMSGYAGEQPEIYGYTAEGGTITVVLPNGEEHVFEPDETGNVDEVFPVALEDNTEITVIFTDAEGGTYQEELLYTSTPTEEDPEEDEEPEEGEETPGDDDQPDEGEDDNSDDSEDGQNEEEETDDEGTSDSEEPPLSESSSFSANLSGYEGDGYLSIDGSAPKNTVVTLTMPDGSTEEVTVDESGSFSVEIDEYPVGSEVNVHFMFEDDSEFEDDLEIKYLGDDDQDGEGSDDGQDDEGSDEGQDEGDDSDAGQDDDDDSEDSQDDGDDSDAGQDDDDSEDAQDEDDSDVSEESGEGQDDDDSEELDEDEVTYSYLEDYGTGIMVHSDSAELLNLKLSVQVLSPSALIDEAHELYDIEIIDEDGNEYDLSNPVTVSIPADGSVSNVYYLGENGETVESVPYSVEEGYVVFEVSDFSQYAVAYNEGTAAESEDTGNGTAAENNDTGDDTAEGHAESADKEDAVTPVDQDTDDNKTSGEKAEELPNTGVAENGLLYSIATLLGALGLGSLVFSRKRKN